MGTPGISHSVAHSALVGPCHFLFWLPEIIIVLVHSCLFIIIRLVTLIFVRSWLYRFLQEAGDKQFTLQTVIMVVVEVQHL